MLGRAVLELTTEGQKFTKGLAEAHKETEGWGSKIGAIGKTAILGIAGIGITAGAALMGAAHEAAEEEKGIFRLAQAVSNAGGDWDGLSDSIERTIHAQEMQTAFSDNEQRDALSMLVALTGNVEEGMRRLPIAMDLARGADIDLVTASRLLGKTSDENTTALGRLGIKLDQNATATDVLNAVTAKFGGQAAAFAGTTAGQLAIVQNEFGNLVEQIGAMVLPVINGALGAILGVVEGLRSWASETGVQMWFANFGQAVGTGLQIVGEFFGVVTGTAPSAGAALKGVVGPEVAGAIMRGLANIRDTFQTIWAVIVDIQKGDLDQLFTDVRQGLARIIGRVELNTNDLTDAFLRWAREFVAWVGPATRELLDRLLGLMSEQLRWIADHGEDIGRGLVEWGGKFGEFIITVAIPAIAENLPLILTKIGMWLVTDAIPSVVRFFFGLGKAIVEGILSGLGNLMPALVEKLMGAVSGALDSVKNFLGIHSPSTVMAEVGANMMQGLAEGITEHRGLVRSALSGAVVSAVSSIDPGYDSPGEAARTTYAGSPQDIQRIREAVAGGILPRSVLSQPTFAGMDLEAHGHPIVVDGRQLATAVGAQTMRGAALAGAPLG